MKMIKASEVTFYWQVNILKEEKFVRSNETAKKGVSLKAVEERVVHTNFPTEIPRTPHSDPNGDPKTTRPC